MQKEEFLLKEQLEGLYNETRAYIKQIELKDKLITQQKDFNKNFKYQLLK